MGPAGEPVSGAIVLVRSLAAPVGISHVVASDTSGAFQFTGLQPERYQLDISTATYQGTSITLQLVGDTMLARLVLRTRIDTLQEVTVNGRPPQLETNNGKLIYNVDQSPSAAGSSAFELLQRMPGVTIDQNDNVLLKGTSGVNVMLDGKMTYMSPGQLANTLKGMPSTNIVKIELAASPGAQYDAAGTSGIINIITRKMNKPGYALVATSSAGVGHYALYNENVTGNIRLKKLNFFGTLGLNHRKTLTDRYFTNKIPSDNGTTVFNSVSHEPYLSKFYTYKAGADWNINSHHTLGIAYSGSWDDWSKHANATTDVTGPDENTSIVQNRSVAIEPYFNNAFNVNYAFIPDSSGKRFTVDADYISYQNHSDGFLANQTYNAGGVAADPYQELKFHQPSYIRIKSVKADATLPVAGMTLQAGAKYAAISIDNDFRYDSLMGGVYEYAGSLSDYFRYREAIAAGYINAEKILAKTSIVAGLRVEHTSTKGEAVHTNYVTNRHYTNLFPSLMVVQKLADECSLTFTASRRINRPAYAELNPVRWYADKYAYYTGNPLLRPELAWQFSTAYTWRSKYSVTLSYNRLNNFISQSVVTDKTTGAVARQNANFPHQDRVEALLMAPLQVARWWELMTTSVVSYTTYPVAQQLGSLQQNRVAADIGLNQVFTLPGATLFELNAHYDSGDLAGIYLTKSYFIIDGGIKRSFLKKHLDLRLSFADLLRTNRFQGTSLSDLSLYSYRYHPDSRRIILTAVYKLGGRVSGAHNRPTEEQQRL
jgi:outer membrane receptor protein involved in Fe transport